MNSGMGLTIVSIVFILVDSLWGFKRGFAAALFRLVAVSLCVFAAFALSAPITNFLLHIPLPGAEGLTVQEMYETFLSSKESVENALALSPSIRALVYHLPEVLVREFSFVFVFCVLRLLTLPVTALLSFIFLRSKKGKFRSGGVLIGVLQGVLCLSVFMVPFFGFLEFGERFDTAFRNSENQDVVEITVALEENILDPIHESAVNKVMETVGLRRLCVSLFHGLSTTTVDFSNGAKKIDYFTYLEDMFPALSALLMMEGMDPEHMTDKDYENLTVVLETAKSKEEITQAVEDVVSGVVTQYVKEDYRATASVVVDLFVEKLLTDEEGMTGEQIKNEVEGVKTILQVLETATSESAESAFVVNSAEKVVDELLKTETLYETLVEIAQDPEKSARIKQDLFSSETQKALAKQEIDEFRLDSLATRSPDEMEKILEITDTLAVMLDITLAPVAAD